MRSLGLTLLLLLAALSPSAAPALSPTCVVPYTTCCPNTEGDVVPFEVYSDTGGRNFSVRILVELLANGDGQKDVRVGWGNNVPEWRKATEVKLESTRGEPTRQVSAVAVTPPCGLLLYATGGSAAAAALVTFELQSIGLTIGLRETSGGGTPGSLVVESVVTEDFEWLTQRARESGNSTGTSVTSSPTHWNMVAEFQVA